MSPRYRQPTDTDKAPGIRRHRPAEHSQNQDQDRDVDDEGRIEDGLTQAASETEAPLRKRRLREREEIGRPRSSDKR